MGGFANDSASFEMCTKIKTFLKKIDFCCFVFLFKMVLDDGSVNGYFS